MTDINFDEWLSGACQVAEEAGQILLGGLGAEHSVRMKGVVDLVTEMDQASEAHILGRLRELYPETSILAEEGGASGPADQPLWIVDPLDGTTNYAHGFPAFCVSLALEREGRIELGVVHDPSRGETFSAVRGRGAWLNGRPLRVTTRDQLGESLLVTGFPYDIRTSPRTNLAAFNALSIKSRAVRRVGAAALDLAYVAAGRFDGYWEEKLAPWDIAAGLLLVEEAGGRLTDYGGGRVVLRAGRVVATNGRIHEALLAALQEVERGLEGPS